MLRGVEPPGGKPENDHRKEDEDQTDGNKHRQPVEPPDRLRLTAMHVAELE
jgi:hypothetical protein